MPLSFTISVEPSWEPVSLAETKAHLRVDGTDEDALIESLISVARQRCEQETDRIIRRSTVVWYLDGFSDEMRPPGGQLASVTTITYNDENNAAQTLSSARYVVDAAAEPGRIVRHIDYEWPSVYGNINDVAITYEAGWASAAAVPKAIKQAILLIVGHYYEHREAVAMGSMSEVPQTVNWLLSGHTLYHVRGA